MTPLEPRLPARRPLLWPDKILDLADAISSVSPDIPLYIVGGAVRDALLHRPVKDLDLATPGDAVALARQITNHFNGDIFVMDAERGVARVFVGGDSDRLIIDVARYRGDDLMADLEGRDFTINAIACDLRGDLHQIVDPLNGEADLNARLLRLCASTAIADDPVRVLRAVRVSVQFQLRMDAELMGQVREYAPALSSVSSERVRDEFVKLLILPRPTAALRVAEAVGVLTAIIPEIAPLRTLKQPGPHVFDAWHHTLMVVEHLARIQNGISYRRTDHTAAVFDLAMLVMQLDRFRAQLNDHLDQEWANDRPHRAVLILAGLVHNVGKAASREDHIDLSVQMAHERAVALKLSSAEQKRLLMMLRLYRQIVYQTDWDDVDVHRFWYRGEEAGVDACFLALADFLGIYGPEIDQDSWLQMVERTVRLLDAYYHQYDRLVRPPVLVDGGTLMQILGLKSGPIVGELLDAIREKQVAGAIHNSDEALAWARDYLQQTG